MSKHALSRRRALVTLGVPVGLAAVPAGLTAMAGPAQAAAALPSGAYELVVNPGEPLQVRDKEAACLALRAADSWNSVAHAVPLAHLQDTYGDMDIDNLTGT